MTHPQDTISTGHLSISQQINSVRATRLWCAHTLTSGLMEVELPHERGQCTAVPWSYAHWSASRPLTFLWSSSSLEWLVMLAHPTTVLYMATPSFKHYSHVLILLHCLEQNNLARVAEELRVNIRIFGHSGDLEYFRKLLFDRYASLSLS